MWYSRKNNLSRTQAQLIGKNRKGQCLFEEAIRDIQQKEPPMQTLVKSNITKNFGLDIKNQIFESISSTRSIRAMSATKSTGSIEDTNIIKFIRNIGPIEFFSILEDITQ
jgi:hypothetical protein